MPPLLRRLDAWFVIILGLLLVAGVVAFLLALRPCRFAVPPGRALSWSLRVNSAEIGADGKAGTPRSSEHRLTLVGLGDGEAVLIAGPASFPPAQAELMHVVSSGGCYRSGRDGRAQDSGVTVAGFDFNLLSLPDGAEQEWRPEVSWAALPEGQRSVTCQGKRTRSGVRPEFRCEFPVSKEWRDPATGRYRQVRGLVTTWKFDTLRGVPLSAMVTFRLYEELPPPGGRRGREMTLELTWIGSAAAGDPERLRPAAQAAAVAAGYVAAGQAPPPDVLARVRSGGGLFASLAEGLQARSRGGR